MPRLAQTALIFKVYFDISRVTKKIKMHKIPKKGRKENGISMEWCFVGISLVWFI